MTTRRRGSPRALVLILVAGALVAGLLAACAPSPAPATTGLPTVSPPSATPSRPASGSSRNRQGGTLIMGFAQEPELLNKYLRTQTVADIAGSFFERGLVQVQPDGRWIPDLARQVPTLENGGVSADGLSVTYHLRENVLWSDGDHFDCQDVRFTWEAIVHPDSGAVTTAGYADIEYVDCPDPYTVVVQFKTFYAPFMTLFADSILPGHIDLQPAEMRDWTYNRFPEPVLGPFRLREWILDDRLTLVRNESYEQWPTAGKPYLDSIVLRWLDSKETATELFQAGEIDFVWDVTEADLEEAKSWPDVKISHVLSTGTERLLLNLRNPDLNAPCAASFKKRPAWHWALGDPMVRAAIESAIDKEALAGELGGYGTTATAELMQGPFATSIAATPYDPEWAVALLQEAGWRDQNDDGVRECHGCLYSKEGTPLKLGLYILAGDPVRERAAERIAATLKEAGIELTVQAWPRSVLMAAYDAGGLRCHGHFDMLMYTTAHGIDPQGRMNGYFASTAIPCDDNAGTGYNYSRWIDEEADAALLTAATSPDPQARRDAYQKVAERVAADRPQIYLYTRSAIDLLRRPFMGYVMNPWSELAWNAQDWYLAGGR